MEMRRLAPRRTLGHWLQWALVSMYYQASGYGTSWLRALRLFALVLLGFALLYGWAGLDLAPFGAAARLSLGPLMLAVGAPHTLEVAFGLSGSDPFNTFWHGLVQSLNVMLLRPNTYAAPVSDLGWFLQTLELALGPIAIAIVVLAIREQFRR